MDEEQERAAFEAEMVPRYGLRIQRGPEGYRDLAMEVAWSAWMARAALSQPASPAPEAMADDDHVWKMMLLKAAALSGDPGAISLAAQLTGCVPCETCGFVKQHCRCLSHADRASPAAPNEGLSQPKSSIYSREPKPYAMTTAERAAWIKGHIAGWDAALYNNEADAGK